MFKMLEQKAMIARVRTSDDELAKRIEVTAVGLKTLRKAFPIVIEVQTRLFGKGRAPRGEPVDDSPKTRRRAERLMKS